MYTLPPSIPPMLRTAADRRGRSSRRMRQAGPRRALKAGPRRPKACAIAARCRAVLPTSPPGYSSTRQRRPHRGTLTGQRRRSVTARMETAHAAVKDSLLLAAGVVASTLTIAAHAANWTVPLAAPDLFSTRWTASWPSRRNISTSRSSVKSGRGTSPPHKQRQTWNRTATRRMQRALEAKPAQNSRRTPVSLTATRWSTRSTSRIDRARWPWRITRCTSICRGVMTSGCARSRRAVRTTACMSDWTGNGPNTGNSGRRCRSTHGRGIAGSALRKCTRACRCNCFSTSKRPASTRSCSRCARMGSK